MQNKLAQPRMALKGKAEQVLDFTLVPIDRGTMNQARDGRHHFRATEPELDVNPARPQDNSAAVNPTRETSSRTSAPCPSQVSDWPSVSTRPVWAASSATAAARNEDDGACDKRDRSRESATERRQRKPASNRRDHEERGELHYRVLENVSTRPGARMRL